MNDTTNQNAENTTASAVEVNATEETKDAAKATSESAVTNGVSLKARPAAPIVQKAEPVKAAVAVKAAETATPAVTVKDTAPVADEQLPEVVAALAVAQMQTQSALHQLLDYVKAMDPRKSQTKASIEQQQMILASALNTILSSEDQNFPTVYEGVLAIVRVHRYNAFKIEARHRGLATIDEAKIDNKVMRFLTRMIACMVTSAGMKDMSKVKEHIDMKKLLESVINARAKQNLTAFYS